MADEKDRTEEQLWAEFERAEAKARGEEVPEVARKEENVHDEPPTEAAAAPAQEPAAAEPAEEPDIWANAPPDLKAAHDAQVRALEAATTEHARRSIEGRIVAYTRRLQERMAAAQQPKTAEAEAADPLAELAAEYPEIATPLQKKLAPITDRISQFEFDQRRRQEAADLEMDADLNANERLLESRHPDWDGYLHENGAAFRAWIVDQPLALRQACMVNQDAIVDPFGAIQTLDAFKQFVLENQPPGPGAETPPVAAQTQGLNPRRAAQLAGAASPQTVGTRPTVSGIPEDGDPQALWKAWADIDPEEKKYRNA